MATIFEYLVFAGKPNIEQDAGFESLHRNKLTP
jgi:hypothetical protein